MPNQNPTYRIYEITLLFALLLPLIIIALYDFNQVWFYTYILTMYSFALVIALIRLNHRKTWKRIDIEIAIVLGAVAIMSRSLFPRNIYHISNTLACLAILFFVYRQTRLPLKDNGLFLSAYSLSYFGLNYKLLDLGQKALIVIVYCIIWSLLFAYALLAARKVKNLYRATFCASLSLLGIVVLSKRVLTADLYDSLILIQAIVNCSLAYCFIHWNSGKNNAHYVFGKNFFNIEILPHTILFLTVIGYSFFSDVISAHYAVLGLVAVVFVWWAIFVTRGFMPLFDKKNLKWIALKQEFKFCFTEKNFFRGYLKSITT